MACSAFFITHCIAFSQQPKKHSGVLREKVFRRHHFFHSPIFQRHYFPSLSFFRSRIFLFFNLAALSFIVRYAPIDILPEWRTEWNEINVYAKPNDLSGSFSMEHGRLHSRSVHTVQHINGYMYGESVEHNNPIYVCRKVELWMPPIGAKPWRRVDGNVYKTEKRMDERKKAKVNETTENS